MELDDLVQDFIARFRSPHRREMRYYASRPTFEDAIRVSALCLTETGIRHSHQRRIPGEVLSAAHRSLVEASDALSVCTHFRELHTSIEGVIGGIHGIGDLAVYDIAHRIGAFLQLEPDVVYLHAGTRKGASILGLSASLPYIEMHQLPAPLRRLSPAEVEDFLCMYKSHLTGRKRGGPTKCGSQPRTPIC